MARILFEVQVDAPRRSVVEALNTRDGIAGWWTDEVTFAGGRGGVMTLGFPVAPMPFELRVDEVSDDRVTWTNVGEFPPHWRGTTIVWTLTEVSPTATTVRFNHEGWESDDGPFAMSAYTWGQLQTRLKSYAESGEADPLFTKRS